MDSQELIPESEIQGRLIFKWSRRGRWLRWQRAFWMRGRKKMIVYGLAIGLIVAVVIFAIVLL